MSSDYQSENNACKCILCNLEPCICGNTSVQRFSKSFDIEKRNSRSAVKFNITPNQSSETARWSPTNQHIYQNSRENTAETQKGTDVQNCFQNNFDGDYKTGEKAIVYVPKILNKTMIETEGDKKISKTIDIQLPSKNSFEISEELLNNQMDYEHSGSAFNNLDAEEFFCGPNFLELNQIFEQSSVHLKQKLRQLYENIEEKFKCEARKIIVKKIQSVSNEITQLREQVNSLRELARNHEKAIAQKDHTIEDLNLEIEKMNQRTEIVLQEQDNRKEKFCAQLADNYHEKRLLAHALMMWKRFLENSWKQKIFNKLKLEARVECMQIKKEYEIKLLQLENELKLSRTEFEALKTKQFSQQNAFKTALMRGVCALNMETMSIFQENLLNLNTEQNLSKTKQNDSFINSHLIDKISDTDKYIDRNFSKLNDIYENKNTQIVLDKKNEHPPGLPEPNHEAWPRSITHEVDTDFDEYPRNSCSIKHSNNLCEKWLGNAWTNQNDYQGSFEVKDPLELSNIQNCSQIDQFGLQTVTRIHQSNKSTDSDPTEYCEKLNHKSYDEDIFVGRIDQTENLSKPDKFVSNKLFSKNLNKFNTIDNAKKLLQTRISFNHSQNTTTTSSCIGRLNSTPKAQTFQYGVPTGSFNRTSSIITNVQVHKHQPIEQFSDNHKTCSYKRTSNQTTAPQYLSHRCINYSKSNRVIQYPADDPQNILEKKYM